MLPSDPSTIGGYRLLGRLGAGGMGVVYLGRTDAGELAAVKVTLADLADRPDFRARFRREVAVARRVTGRWVVRVVDADPAADEPWLATEFVPGPSLGEAVAECGPLPERTVRVLGARLAVVLAAAHRGGLVHRDVKPGNVLLALDGPRLIDFGIARTVGATELTASGVMVGSPGYLAPEQARLAGAGEVGPASDVFALGCVLAYAATGRRPFGTGAVAAIVYRTVHEEADLDGVPDGLLELVRCCLAKTPSARPTAREVATALAPPAGHGPDAQEPDARGLDAREPDAPADPLLGPPFDHSSDHSPDWLPDGLPALIAKRSARVLDLPVPTPTVVNTPVPDAAALDPRIGPDGAPRPPRGPARRRLLAQGSAAVATAATGTVAWPAIRPDGRADDGPGGPLPRHRIGVATDLSGPGRAHGRAQERGARLDVETFNSRRDRPFDLELTVLDDRGQPAAARAAATRLVGDRAVVAVLGPGTVEIARAARCAVALRDAGHTGLRGATEPIAGPAFRTAAGTAADGWIIGTGYVDTAQMPGPRAQEFRTAFRERWRVQDAGPHAVEAYDAVHFVAEGLRRLGARAADRGELARRLGSVRYEGVAKTIAFPAGGDKVEPADGFFTYRTERGRLRFLGPYKKVTKDM
ncbi:bifunctional serine/threonine-protein kinase/ABC transporter substrate-binding protein [Streptomyces sp. NPDC003860]